MAYEDRERRSGDGSDGALDESLGATGVFSTPRSGVGTDEPFLADMREIGDSLEEPRRAGQIGHSGQAAQAGRPGQVGLGPPPVKSEGLSEPLVHRIVLEPRSEALPAGEADAGVLGSAAEARARTGNIDSGVRSGATKVDPNAGFTQLLRTLTDKPPVFAAQPTSAAGRAADSILDHALNTGGAGERSAPDGSRGGRDPGFTSLLKKLGDRRVDCLSSILSLWSSRLRSG